MNFKRILLFTLTFLLMLPTSIIFNQVPIIEASPEPKNEDEKPPISGTGYTQFSQDWFVDDDETLYYGNQTIDLIGNLTINSTGKLILYNVTLQMNCSFDSEFGIIVEEGGVFNLTETKITGVNNKTWSFNVFGNMSMDNCNISFMHASKHPVTNDITGGLQIYSGNVTVNNTYFCHNHNNLLISSLTGDSAIITNNTITLALRDALNKTISRGIITTNYTKALIFGNNISDVQRGIEILGNSEPYVNRNTILNNDEYGIYARSTSKNIRITNNTIGNHSGNINLRLEYNWKLGDGPGGVIKNNNLFNSSTGIYYDSNGYSVINNNHIYENNRGIYLDRSTSLIIDNTIENNTEVGIRIESWNNPVPRIEKNRIKYNNNEKTSSDGYGIVVDSSSGRVTDNIIEHNGPSTSTDTFVGGGIQVTSGSGSANPRIDNNTIRYNSKNGIDVDSGSKPVIEDNDILYTNHTGIFITDTTNIDLIGNTVSYGKYGLHLVDYSAWIVDNTIDHHSDYGIFLEDNSRPQIKENIISHNGNGESRDSGILLDGSLGACNARIFLNDISNNTGFGIKVENSAPTIEENEIKFNTDGIYFYDCSGTVNKNGIRHNTGIGMRIELIGAMPTLNDNVFNDNNIGAHIYQTDPVVQNNWFRSNNIGLKISGYSWPTVDTNVFNYNSVGLKMEYSRIKLYDCDFSGNTQRGIDVTGSNFTIENCTIQNSGNAEISLDDNSHLSALNTTFDKNKISFIDNPSELKNYWFINIRTENEQGNPLVNALVQIENNTNDIVVDRRTPASGELKYVPLMEFRSSKTEKIFTTPHSVFVELAGYASETTDLAMDVSKSIVVSLEKNSKPSMVTNIRPDITHDPTPLINWSPSVDMDGDLITYYINLTTDSGADVEDHMVLCLGPYYQVETPLSFGNGENTYYITIKAVDTKGSYSLTKSSMVVVNHQPFAPQIMLDPGQPNKITGITCKIKVESIDEDNDNITYDFNWYKNGMYQPSLTLNDTDKLESSVPADVTDDGEKWKCVVRAFDGFFYSPSVESAEVEIKNFDPELNDTPFNIVFNEDEIAENAFNLEYVFHDENQETLTYEWDTHKYITVVENNSWISFISAPNWYGQTTFTFSARDFFAKISFQIKVTVESVNDLPVMEPIGPLEAVEDLWFNYTIKATDYADGDKLTYNTNITEAMAGKGLLMSENYLFSKSTGELSLKPSNNMVGKYKINVTVEDINDGIVFEVIEFTVKNVNDKPMPVISFPKNGAVYKVGEPVLLDGGNSTDEDSVFGDSFNKIQWKLESGDVISTKLRDYYTFDEPGTYKLKLILNDSKGEESLAEVTITIEKAKAEEEEEGGFSDLLKSPAVVASLSMVAVIIIMIIIVIIISVIRKKREKQKLVEAGILTKEDLKKAKEAEKVEKAEKAKEEELEEPGKIQPLKIPMAEPLEQPPAEGAAPPAPAAIPIAAPAPQALPVGAPAPVELGPDQSLLAFQAPSAEVPKGEAVEAEEAQGPAWGPAIGFESDAEETGLKEEVKEGEEEEGAFGGLTFKKPSEATEPAEGELMTTGIMPEMPQVNCPRCGSSAQDHPSDSNKIICPACGEVEK
ncbi:MAG: right-handed parallel beta-helix repeat-containing protein [Thermoplasmata archaeon]|nr:MAG: right-handed parallel beta-helix repeat-containing protein [Thermoplasmata archaeon]